MDPSGKFRDVHNDHGVQWTLLEPQPNQKDLLETATNENFLLNFWDFYRDRKESTNELWRSQLRKSAKQSRNAESTPRPIKKPPVKTSQHSIESSSTAASDVSLRLFPSIFGRAKKSVCAMSFSTTTPSSGRPVGQSSSQFSAQGLADTSSDFIRQLISVNMKHNSDDQPVPSKE